MGGLVLGCLAGGIIGYMLITVGKIGNSTASVTCGLVGYIICIVSVLVFFFGYLSVAMRPLF